MRISDWSSDVCSSDLREQGRVGFAPAAVHRPQPRLVDSLLEFVGARRGDLRERQPRGARQRSVLPPLDPARAQNKRLQFLGGEHQRRQDEARSEDHTSELHSLMRISYAVFCLTKNNKKVQPKQKL